MDLVQSIRKEGSRGGRGEFKWDDVKTSNHRENYLGHSLMAPVGRWQKNKDLSWYAKADADGQPMSEADARKEELRRVKQAEDEAMAKALGVELPGANANLTALGDRDGRPTTLEHQALDRGGPPKGGRDNDDRETRPRRHRSRDGRESRKHERRTSRERERRHRHRSRDRSRSREAYRRRERSRSRDRRRSRSQEERRQRRPRYEEFDERRRQSDRGSRRSRSPNARQRY